MTFFYLATMFLLPLAALAGSDSATQVGALACLYNDVGFKGKFQCLSQPGYYDVGYNDAISSIGVVLGCTLTVATDGGLQGKTTDFTTTAEWVGDDFNDQISSVKLTCT